MEAYFAMGGYAGFVWPAYGLTVVVLVGLLVASLRAQSQTLRQAKLLEEARPRRRERGQFAASRPAAPQKDPSVNGESAS